MKPVVRQIDPAITPSIALKRLQSLPHCCLLESARQHEERGRYSFLAIDPFSTIRLTEVVSDPLDELHAQLSQFEIETDTTLPPFQGGAAGLLSYELGQCFEKIPATRHDEFELPLAMLGLYDVVISWDHVTKKAYIVSQGLPINDPAERETRAIFRADEIESRLNHPVTDEITWRQNRHATAHGLTAAQYNTRLNPSWLGNFDGEGFRNAVGRAIEYVHAGDIFQVNLAQRLIRMADCSPVDLYRRLRRLNPAPFAGFFDLGTHAIVSASPERFLKVSDRIVETRPIKGTRKRTGQINIDRKTVAELRSSPKDNAENTMIVDLMRNDLSRVCQHDSIVVKQLCEIEEYEFVVHLVSSIRGRLREDRSLCDLIAATFPGGSITGAPKVRAMEIIAELEPTARGAYCGSLGYFGFDGQMDTNILIRTITASRGWWQLQVGGGIVADSQPTDEEEETWVKAAGLVNAIDTNADPAQNADSESSTTQLSPPPTISSLDDSFSH